MRTRTQRAVVAVALAGLFGLPACQAEVDTQPEEGGVRVDVEASEPTEGE